MQFAAKNLSKRDKNRVNVILRGIISLFVLLAPITPAWSMVSFDPNGVWPWNRTTDDGPDAQVGGFYINLGITGARAKITNANLKALQVAYIWANTPASGKLQVGDLIVGANGKAFTVAHRNGGGSANFGGEGPSMAFGNALEESQGGSGILTLDVRRDSQNLSVQLNIGTKYGEFSSTFPYNCPKTDLLLSELHTFLASQQQSDGTWGGGYWYYPVTFKAAMALLASGDSKYYPNVKKAAEYFASLTDGSIEGEMEGLNLWKYNYGGILLSEYYLATQESWVLPELEQIKSWLIQAQYTDTSQRVNWTHEITAHDNQLGAWHHNPYFGGYGPFNAITCLSIISLCLMDRCGIDVPKDRLQQGYHLPTTATNSYGYVHYGHPVYGSGEGWADLGRTGESAIANFLAPFTESKYSDMASLNAKCIGYEGRYKGLPDSHASPTLGMIFTALGSSLDDQGYRNLMDYHRWWFSLAQTHDGSQFVSQPNREGGGEYAANPRVTASAVAALVLSAKNRKLVMTGKGNEVPDNKHPTVSIVNPAHGASFTTPATLAVRADASDPDGSIERVELRNNDTLVATEYDAPYDYSLNNLGEGTYTLQARAYDNLGAATNTTITFSVKSDIVPVFQAVQTIFTKPEFLAMQNGEVLFGLPKESAYLLYMYNMQGKQIVQPVAGIGPAGVNTVSFSKLGGGIEIPNEMYLLRLETDDKKSIVKFLNITNGTGRFLE